MNELILSQLSEQLCRLGSELGFNKTVVRSNGCFPEVYVINKHALQLEVDWHENNLFAYVVFLKHNTLPNESVNYCYGDGQWCRKYLEEVFNIKHPFAKSRTERYSSTYLCNCLEFYSRLITNNSAFLKDFGKGKGPLFTSRQKTAPNLDSQPPF